MGDGQGYQILHNVVPGTFRDRRETAFEAAQFAKSQAETDIIELRDCATGEKLLMLADGWLTALHYDKDLTNACRTPAAH